ncbi:MAG: secretin N-terminal domain-containing protein, partial [Candidatus Susulua stagnicola]|nr:secretin N-terminal domain-containing protein [Candidatus Susulua stagnicola]
MRENTKDIKRRIKLVSLLILFSCCVFSFSFAQDDAIIPVIKFKDADIRVVIQSIAQKAIKDGKKINIVVSPSVEGLVSVSLENVDWFSTLEAILRPYDYSYEWVGETILLIDTTEKIGKRETLAKEREEIEALDTRVFSLSFAKVLDIKEAIEGMLSSRGRLTIDKRTNALVVTDVQSNLSNL